MERERNERERDKREGKTAGEESAMTSERDACTVRGRVRIRSRFHPHSSCLAGSTPRLGPVHAPATSPATEPLVTAWPLHAFMATCLQPLRPRPRVCCLSSTEKSLFIFSCTETNDQLRSRTLHLAWPRNEEHAHKRKKIINNLFKKSFESTLNELMTLL